MAFDERLELLALVVAAAHRVGVNAQGEGRVGVAELLHHIGRVLGDRDQDRGERVPQLVRGDAERQRLHPAFLDEPVRVGDRGVDDVLAKVVAGARRPGGGDEHRVVWAGPLARGLVLGQDLPQQRQHVDLAHAGVGLVPADLEPSVREVDVTPQHRPGRGRPSAAEEQRGERRAPAGRVGRVALGPAAAPAIGDVDDGGAAVELARGLTQDRDLLGASPPKPTRSVTRPASSRRATAALVSAVPSKTRATLGHEVDQPPARWLQRRRAHRRERGPEGGLYISPRA